jgi:hypothetical protein
MSADLRLYRNRTGDVIHHEGCRHIKSGAVHWDWADETLIGWVLGKPLQCGLSENSTGVLRWLTACKACQPDDEEAQNAVVGS